MQLSLGHFLNAMENKRVAGTLGFINGLNWHVINPSTTTAILRISTNASTNKL